MSLTAAMQPSIEDIAMGALPGLPKVEFHWPLVDFQVGSEFSASNCCGTRRDFVEYDVEADATALGRMLQMTGGRRTVPVLVENGHVTQIGWHGLGCVVDAASPEGRDSA